MEHYTYEDITNNTEHLILNNLAHKEDIESAEKEISSLKSAVAILNKGIKFLIFLMFVLLFTLDAALIVGGISI